MARQETKHLTPFACVRDGHGLIYSAAIMKILAGNRWRHGSLVLVESYGSNCAKSVDEVLFLCVVDPEELFFVTLKNPRKGPVFSHVFILITLAAAFEAHGILRLRLRSFLDSNFDGQVGQRHLWQRERDTRDNDYVTKCVFHGPFPLTAQVLILWPKILDPVAAADHHARATGRLRILRAGAGLKRSLFLLADFACLIPGVFHS